ncbi:vitamin B6 biosynthesis protein [Fragilariopsis cylindrus CCMP1102]|uniref:pyridoxal 5'-phosphate synthase (glutamine hydrolyzing) n=1 Tax=Fragilariopsis cylindrus CCMP1102 TaxID=635003 RepID=A0A1E7FG75_9STRA|nr:vitamin B6 biosynthesis protein [Fragilariopsis cylindrus CCMP1102]|eukprot:OEU17172.1 vitamin B6 biosynthesis protein [Fragilariopsis cylindrus CCMP1102]
MSDSNGNGNESARVGTSTVKQGLAQMLKGGVIMDVMNVEQAKLAEAAGAVAVMALERIPADIRRDGGVARMSDPLMIQEIKNAVTIPVMAKARIGHFVEAQILEALEVDFIDESEVLTMADDTHHLDKTQYNVPFVCGCRDLGEALRRIAEGASMLRTKGEAGTGNVVEAVRHARQVQGDIRRLKSMSKDELYVAAKEMRAPYELVKQVAEAGKLPVVNFAAGGVATPADAALMMQLGLDGVFVGSGIFKSANPEARARAIVQATTHFRDPKVLVECSTGLGPAMVGICDIKADPVNFRDREGGEYTYEGKVPPKKELHGHTETQMYGSSWNR